MNQRKWVFGVALTLVFILAFAGFMAIAAELGAKEDPKVAVSYIKEELLPQLDKRIDDIVLSKLTSYTNEFEKKVETLRDEVNTNVAGGGNGQITDAYIDLVAEKVAARISSGGISSGSNIYQKVEVGSGKTLIGKIGTEIILRVGSATCVGSSSPGLVDLSSSGELAPGKSLEKSHLYLITIDPDRGFKANSDVTVFVRGPYTIN